MGWDWVHLVLRPLFGLLYQPRMIGEGDCGAVGGMKIGRGNRSTRRKPALAPLCPPQIPLDQPRDRTRAGEMGSQRLTAWAMARPQWILGRFFSSDVKEKPNIFVMRLITDRKPIGLWNARRRLGKYPYVSGIYELNISCERSNT
jgi:hypothetical protein